MRILDLNNERKSMFIGFCSLLMIAIVLSIRNLYSFSWSDESFYIAGVHRLFLGGKPFVDEWHSTQFYTVLLLPFYSIYVKLSGGGCEGIYLWARNFYLFLAFLVAYYVFYIFRVKARMKMQCCILAGGLVMLYSRANIMGISYHNFFCLSIITASMLLIKVFFDYEKMSRIECGIHSIMVGIFTGIGVITIPTALFMVGSLFIILIFFALFRRKNMGKIHIVIGVLSGMVLDVFGYFAFVLTRVSYRELVSHIGHLFQDSDHEAKSMIDYFSGLSSLICTYGKYIILFIIAAICIRIAAYIRKKYADLYIGNVLLFASIPVLIYSLYAYASSHMGTYIVFGLYGIFLFILFSEEGWMKDRKFVRMVSVLGIAAVIMIGAFMLASATSDPMSAGFVCISLITLILLDKKTPDLKQKYGRIAEITVTGILLGMFAMTGWVKLSTVYRDAPLSQMDTMLGRGPARGLITTAEHADQYNACMDAVDYINKAEKGTKENVSVMISKIAPWMYVGMNIQNGAPTAWKCGISDSKVEEYFFSHDINCLKYVLVLQEEYGGYIGAGNPEGTYLTPNENDISGWLGDILDKEYNAVDMECGTLYVRNGNGR